MDRHTCVAMCGLTIKNVGTMFPQVDLLEALPVPQVSSIKRT